MESKFKRFMKNPWTISIGSGLIVLVITIIIDAVSTKQIFSTIGAIFVAIWNGIVVFLNFDVKVWWILVALVFIFLVLYAIYKITDTKPFPKNHPMSYRQDNILGYKWKWLWIKDDTGCYNIDHLPNQFEISVVCSSISALATLLLTILISSSSSLMLDTKFMLPYQSISLSITAYREGM